MTTTLDDCRDTAQQIVTATLAGDRGLASRLAQDFPYPAVLALALADLTAYTHVSWMRSVLGWADSGPTREERERLTLSGWQALMVDVETWRADQP